MDPQKEFGRSFCALALVTLPGSVGACESGDPHGGWTACEGLPSVQYLGLHLFFLLLFVLIIIIKSWVIMLTSDLGWIQ